jgi:hypothetical protein
MIIENSKTARKTGRTRTLKHSINVRRRTDILTRVKEIGEKGGNMAIPLCSSPIVDDGVFFDYVKKSTGLPLMLILSVD